MKKIAITLLLASTLLLTGCLGFGEDAPVVTSTADQKGVYANGEFQAQFPETWEVFGKRDFTSEISSNTQTVFRSKKKNEVFIANVSVVKNILPEGMIIGDYSKKLNESSAAVLQNYKKLDEKDESGKMITIFQGKRSTKDPLLKFVQTIISKEKTILIATAAFITNEDEVVAQEAQNIAQSIQFVQ
ncbi:MAG: hypothetical protein AAB551_03405 [Patescibacteria group bacterium]